MEFLIPLVIAVIFGTLLFIYQDRPIDNFRPSKIYIIKQGEENEVLESAKSEKNSAEFYLNSRGKERARLLTELIRKINPVALYTPMPRDNGNDFRPRQTVEPASFELDIPIYGSFFSFQTEDSVQEIFSKKEWDNKTIFICWENIFIQKLLRVLMDDNLRNSDDFNTMYILDYDATNKKYLISETPENLLFSG